MTVTKYNLSNIDDRAYLIEVANDILSRTEDDIQENIVAQALISACAVIDMYEMMAEIFKSYVRAESLE